jgi:hypothetical protein
MTNKQLQNFLGLYPDEMPVKLLIGSSAKDPIIDLDGENILHTSETAFVNTEAPEDEWDCEDGKIELGDGKQFLLFNPIIT